MSLSREARIIIVVLAVVAVGFVWLTFFSQDGVALDGPVVAGVADADGSPAALAAEEEADQQVASDEATPALAREVELATLPFLVTAPPTMEFAEEEEEDEPGLVRPAVQRRATVNPFSPIIVRQPTAPTRTATAEASRDEADPRVVDVPDAPPSPATPEPTRVTAPAPSPLAPPAPRAGSLPRALPSGTLPVAIEPLATTRVAEARPQPEELAQVAAIRVPQPQPEVRVLEPEEPEAEESGERLLEAEDVPEPLAVTRDPAVAEAPLFAGANGLARYLRDHSVSFTGAVHGPVGFGIFRSAESEQPIIVGLGQTLPGTDIVLTDLQGQQAELTQGDFKQTLILDLRR